MGEIAMVVYPGSCWWLQPEERAMTQDEIRRLVAEFAAQSKLKVEIAFATGSEIVHPA
ncbi:MAG TPA: hypothetical protein VM686_15565 [Polyangiaceae bacterium]|nr:hypothetical protein [Polyangiaceae bacterium]